MQRSTRATGQYVMLIALATLGAAPISAAAQGAPARTTVEEHVLLVAEPQTTYFVSPKGQHVVAVVNRGSRLVVVHDGVDGPRFDEIGPEIAFSDDGSRYAYVARLGQEFVYMVDGKELMRVPGTTHGVTQFNSNDPGFPKFDESGKRVYFELRSKPASGGYDENRVYVDGRPGPAAHQWIEAVTFSPNGERHAYITNNRSAAGPGQTLVVDGKPAGYLAGAPQFTADGKSLFTKRGIPGTEGTEVLLDGKPYMRGQASVELYIAPAGTLVIGVVQHPIRTGTPPFLTLGNKKIPGSECVGTRGVIDNVYFTPDGKHYAARCQSGTGSWVMADGKKGQEYQQIASGIFFTADGQPVYQAESGGKQFIIVGDQESDAYQVIRGNPADVRAPMRAAEREGIPVAIRGNRVGFVANSASNSYVVVVDGKAGSMTYYAGELEFSPDGAHYAYVFSDGAGDGHRLVVNGKALDGLPFAQADGRRHVFSPNWKHVAYAAHRSSDAPSPGVALDGKFMPLTDAHSIHNFTFTPDDQHLIWVVRSGRAARHRVYVDGQVALDLPSNLELERGVGEQWSMGDDGVLTFIAQDGDKIKRYRVTPGTSTSVETMLGGRGGAASAPSSAPVSVAATAAQTEPENASAPPERSRLATIGATLSNSSTQHGWTNIKPGETSFDLVQQVLGPAPEQKNSFNGDYSVWRSTQDARELWLRFSSDNVVHEMIVLPARQLREQQITELFGSQRQRLNANSDGSSVVAYPAGMAIVEYAQNGLATRISVGTGAMQRAQAAALKAKAAEGIRSLLRVKKTP